MQTPEMNRDFGCAHASLWPLDLNLDLVSHKFDKRSQMLQITNSQLAGQKEMEKIYQQRKQKELLVAMKVDCTK
jgi:predicted nucleotidyltransferase